MNAIGTPVSTTSSVVSSLLSNQGSNSSSLQTTPDLSPHHHHYGTDKSRAIFVEALVDSSVLILETIWPSIYSGSMRLNPQSLRKFIQETLKRSRTSYSTFQVALYYLILVKPLVGKLNEQCADAQHLLKCGRRCFLTALMLASKYLQDRNYSLGAWSTISGLAIPELKRNETAFLKAVDYRVHIQPEVYHRWSEILLSSALEDEFTWSCKVRSMGPTCVVESIAVPEYCWDEFVEFGNDDQNDDEEKQEEEGEDLVVELHKNTMTWPMSPEVSDVEDVKVNKAEDGNWTKLLDTNDEVHATKYGSLSYLATPPLSEHGVKRSFEEEEEEADQFLNAKRFCV